MLRSLKRGRASKEELLNCFLHPFAAMPASTFYRRKQVYDEMRAGCNRPFPSSLVPLFQNESKCETFLMKMSSACSFIFMQIKLIFIRMVSHLDSL